MRYYIVVYEAAIVTVPQRVSLGLSVEGSVAGEWVGLQQRLEATCSSLLLKFLHSLTGHMTSTISRHFLLPLQQDTPHALLSALAVSIYSLGYLTPLVNSALLNTRF